jgi:tRNA (adenine57-N1/adenine58-N1)-methyltransferase
MAKILFKKEKKVNVEGRERILSKHRYYYVREESKDFHSVEGVVAKKDLKKKDGSEVVSSEKHNFVVFSPSFIDSYKNIRRSPQMPLPKDIGLIIAETGIGKKSTVVDAGGGSGGISCFLANIVKEITTYEIEKDFAELINENIKFLDLKNIKVKNRDVAKGIDEKDVDLVTLDMLDPWRAVGVAEKALKTGGFLVCYTTNIAQTQAFVKTVGTLKNLVYFKTVELMGREWKITEIVARPKSQGVLHSGFLVFCRKI